MRLITLITLFLVGAQLSAQEEKVDSAKNDRLNSLSLEIANLTRTPLGKGDLILKQWVKYTIEEKEKTKVGSIHFSKEDSTVVWFDDVARSSSFFYRASPTSPIVTISTKSNQGTELTQDIMMAMGFLIDDGAPTHYEILNEAPEVSILGRTCTAATSEISEENTEITTFWCCRKGGLKKEERLMIKRAIDTWCSNQTAHNRIQSSQLQEDWNILGVSKEGFEFRILDWGEEGDFALALDQIMVNVPGRDLNQIAKEHYEKHMEESQKED